MIQTVDNSSQALVPEENTNTFKVLPAFILGQIDELEATKQSILHCLQRPKGSLIGYPTEYGFDHNKFIGQSRLFIETFLLGDIQEALSFLTEVTGVTMGSITEDTTNMKKLNIRVNISTIYGDIEQPLEIEDVEYGE